MRYLIKFSYDGSNFSGFQKQKGLRTIEDELDKALTKINNGKETSITATGRTDKKVHALMQYGHADIDVKITGYKLKRALNSNLPNDIHVIDTIPVENNFHARYNVKEKTYMYIINTGEYNPIERNYVYQYNYTLDVEKMKEAIKYFEGVHDFRSFVTDNKEKLNCVREIFSTNIVEKDNKIIITFTGNGFLRYQVRNMVGILIRVGQNKLDPLMVRTILEEKDRTKSGRTAPPEGLYLTDIKYATK